MRNRRPPPGLRWVTGKGVRWGRTPPTHPLSRHPPQNRGRPRYHDLSPQAAMEENRDWATLSPQEFAQLQKYLDCKYWGVCGCSRMVGGLYTASHTWGGFARLRSAAASCTAAAFARGRGWAASHVVPMRICPLARVSGLGTRVSEVGAHVCPRWVHACVRGGCTRVHALERFRRCLRSPDSSRKVQDVLQDFYGSGTLSRHRQGEVRPRHPTGVFLGTALLLGGSAACCPPPILTLPPLPPVRRF